MADTLRALVAVPAPHAAEDADARRVRGQLAALGVPVQHDAVEPPSGPVEETVMRGVQAAHHDPDVARTLPVCLYRQRDRLDVDRLRQHALRLNEKQSLGFFLDLTAELSGGRLSDDGERLGPKVLATVEGPLVARVAARAWGGAVAASDVGIVDVRGRDGRHRTGQEFRRPASL